MAHEHLIEAYKFHRNAYPKGHANVAFERAKADMAAGKRRYTCQFTWQNKYNINPPHAAYGENCMRFVEHPGELWRFTGTAQDIACAEGYFRSIDHTGWYTRFEDYSEKTCGVVFQLPARNGKPRYVAGFSDPANKTNERSSASVSFDQFFDDKMGAARAADRLAELMAEESREYDEAWCAGSQYTDFARDIATLRKEALATIQDAKKMACCKLRIRASLEHTYPALYATLCGLLKGSLAEIGRFRAERAKLLDEFGKHKGFAEGQN